ncbi:MAG TPA: hypothetical protein VL947_11990, partial [Cytophagales bacterium]|nr:hypothetical protein [Cytophagales bacterium]
VLDESKAVTDTISIEVAEESDEHQFVFTTNKAGLSVSYAADDIDEKGYPVGLYPTIRTKALKGQQANLQVVLYHLPGVKKASPVENAKNGSPDLDVIFADIHIK